jgi:hypothetical protein
MVPIVEMFNHECTDVYYDFDYLEDNANKPSVFNFKFRLLKDSGSLFKDNLKKSKMSLLLKTATIHKLLFLY